MLGDGIGAEPNGPEGLAALSDAPTRQAIVEHARRLARTTGLPAITCLTIPVGPTDDPPRILLRTGSAAWSRIYEHERLDRDDPGLREARRQSQPFTWSELVHRRRHTPGERAMLSRAAMYGLTDAFITPVWESGGSLGVVTLAGARVPSSPTARAELAIASVLLHTRLVALKRRPRASDDVLTEREWVIVNWIAAGKSDWQIGQILDISAKTVNYHVENLKRKLGVASRIQAVLRALQLGRRSG